MHTVYFPPKVKPITRTENGTTPSRGTSHIINAENKAKCQRKGTIGFQIPDARTAVQLMKAEKRELDSAIEALASTLKQQASHDNITKLVRLYEHTLTPELTELPSTTSAYQTAIAAMKFASLAIANFMAAKETA
jgi:hypothetical protein